MADISIEQILDTEVVKDFRRLFYEVTGLFTSFSFPGWNKGRVDVVPKKAKLRYCSIIQKSSIGKRKCCEHDAECVNRLKNSMTPNISLCHAGITGVEVPVFRGDEFLGAIFAGDFLVSEPTPGKFKVIKKRLSGMKINLDELEEAYYEIPVESRKNLRIAIELMSLIVNYVVDREQIITLQEEIYQKQNEIAHTLTSNSSVEQTLQNKVNEVHKLRNQLMITMGNETNVVLTEDNGNRRSRIIKEAISFIDKYYCQNITLADVADHVNLSPTYLSALFRKECKHSFMDYLVQKRLARACELLQDLRMNVTAVSMRVGYQNISYFNQLFKKHLGVPPGQYRNRLYLTED